MLLVCICVGYGIILISGVILPKKVFSSYENRMLAQKPQVSKEGVLSGKYSKGYEYYVTDQFPYRDSWITLKTYREILLQKKEISGTYLGKDNYFFSMYKNNDVDAKVMENRFEYCKNFILAAINQVVEVHT